MRFDFLENKHEKHAFAFSISVIVLSIIAFASFALTGGSLLFYFFAALSIALGFYLAYHLSKTPAAVHATGKAAKKRTRKR